MDHLPVVEKLQYGCSAQYGSFTITARLAQTRAERQGIKIEFRLFKERSHLWVDEQQLLKWIEPYLVANSIDALSSDLLTLVGMLIVSDIATSIYAANCADISLDGIGRATSNGNSAIHFQLIKDGRRIDIYLESWRQRDLDRIEKAFYLDNKNFISRPQVITVRLIIGKTRIKRIDLKKLISGTGLLLEDHPDLLSGRVWIGEDTILATAEYLQGHWVVEKLANNEKKFELSVGEARQVETITDQDSESDDDVVIVAEIGKMRASYDQLIQMKSGDRLSCVANRNGHVLLSVNGRHFATARLLSLDTDFVVQLT